jgi:hypothetical protein
MPTISGIDLKLEVGLPDGSFVHKSLRHLLHLTLVSFGQPYLHQTARRLIVSKTRTQSLGELRCKTL